MTFALSRRSRDRLVGVAPELVAVVERAILLTKVDFGVTEGVRTLERQREMVAKGASQTMDSKHVIGRAVDLVAYVGPRISWELSLYNEVAEAMRTAAVLNSVPLRWGGAWNVQDIRRWEGSMEDAMEHYVAARRAQGARPFIDAPHFELVT
jgi:peptidoglycan L-alanyl-D-glutamate endopeptidase CwlK